MMTFVVSQKIMFWTEWLSHLGVHYCHSISIFCFYLHSEVSFIISKQCREENCFFSCQMIKISILFSAKYFWIHISHIKYWSIISRGFRHHIQMTFPALTQDFWFNLNEAAYTPQYKLRMKRVQFIHFLFKKILECHISCQPIL